jgi:uncharacterized protein (TIGR00251 family)
MDEGLEDLRIDEKGGACTFAVKVTPRSSREILMGVEQGALRLKVTAPPVEGEANEALRTFLARLLDRPRSSIQVLRGGASRRKTVRVDGISAAEIRRLVAQDP